MKHYNHQACLKQLIIFIGCFFICSINLNGQVATNKGKLFWVGFMDHTDGDDAALDLYITSDVTTSGTVSIPGQSWTTNYTVTANQMTIVSVPEPKSRVKCADCIQNKGIKVTAKKPVVVYSHIHENNQSDATLVLPVESTGQNYFVMSYRQEKRNEHCQFMIIASKDSTTIKITPTDKVGNRAANKTYTILLDEGEVYQGQAPDRYDDLTGTKIEVIDTGINAGCRNISVFAGSTYTNLGCGNSRFQSGDNLYQQLYAVSAWSNTFVTVPFMDRSYDRFRILASKDNTIVFIDGIFKTRLNAGQFYETGNVKNPQYIYCSNPVMVAQFQITQRCGGTGDPSMTILSPVQQTLKDITLYSSKYENISANYINIIMPTADIGTFRLDGKVIKFTKVPARTAFSYAREKVNEGNHSLKADKGFLAIAYGFGRYESYGYSAGANFANLNQYITLGNSNANVINTVCMGDSAKFLGNANFEVSKWEWNFGDGNTSKIQNPTHKYKDTGTYNVKMFTYRKVLNGCSTIDSAELLIKVVSVPEGKISIENGCFGDSVHFSSTYSVHKPSSIESVIWDFGDKTRKFGQNAVKLYDSVSKYPINFIIKSTDECILTITDTLEIYTLPETKFFVDNPCFKDPVVLRDSSQDTVNSITKWIWNMGDGTIDTLLNNKTHSYKYDTSGNFLITLTTINSGGCSTSADTLLYKYDKFLAAFSFEDACLKSPINFSDTSHTSNIAPTSRIWDFGDGNTSSLKSVKHLYKDKGTYDVKLKIVQNQYCADSITHSVNVHAQVSLDFSSNNFCLGDTSILSAIHTPSSEKTDSFVWKYKGVSYSGLNWNFIFPDSGVHNFSLFSTTNNGCNDTLDSSIAIYPKPEASFTNSSICEFNEAVLVNSSKDFGKGFKIIDWLSKSSSSLFKTDTFRYIVSTSGTESIRLIVESNQGCKDTINKDIKIWELPKIDFTVTNECIGMPIAIVNNTTVKDDVIKEWDWDLGDSKTSTIKNPQPTYSIPGLKDAILTVKSGNDCINKDTVQFEIYPLPNMEFTFIESCVNTPTTYANTSSISKGTIDKYSYNFGDGRSSSIASPTNTYITGGKTYRTSLIGTSNYGCVDSVAHDVKSHAIPVVDFTANPLEDCAPLVADFTDATTVDGDIITEWEWKQNGSIFSTNNPASYSFKLPGTKGISLKATSAFGCEQTLVKNALLTIFTKPFADFSFTPLDPTTSDPEVTFTDKSIAVSEWNWDFGDGGTSTIANPVYSYTDSGNYLVRLEVLNTDGCADDTSFNISVLPSFLVFVPNAFSPNGDQLNATFGPGGKLKGVGKYELIIYNRWGEILFQTKDVNQRWDGTYMGNPVPEGLYPFVMRYMDYKFTKWFTTNDAVYLKR